MRGQRPRNRAGALTAKTESSLDGLYGGPPADFIKGRNALAKRLKEDGDEAEAARIKALRKPSKAAALVNALAISEKEPVVRYLGLAEKLREATSGKVDSKRMRELAREEGELLEELVASAGKLGDGASASTLDRVRETLQAAQVDSDLAERLLAGRVEREERAASVGLENLVSAPQAVRKAPAKSKKPRRGKTEARELKARRRRAAEARQALKAAETQAREAAREVARSEGELAKAERARDVADARVERAKEKLAALT